MLLYSWFLLITLLFIFFTTRIFYVVFVMKLDPLRAFSLIKRKKKSNIEIRGIS